jgi:hypothetical protein
MAVPTTTEKIKLPGESTTNPSFASPQIQTAADVRQSQQVTGGMSTPSITTPTVKSPAPSVTPEATAPKQTTSSIIPSTSSSTEPKATPAVTSAPATTPASTVPTSSGAPPGVPLTTPNVPPAPTVGLAPTMGSTQGKNAAEDDYLQSKNENAQKLYEAALAYNGGPTSDLAKAQTAAENNLRSATNTRGAAGTIDSSLYGEDKTKIATDQATEDEAAYVKYQEAVTAADDAMSKAQIAFARATEQEKKEITEAAERRNALITEGPAPTTPAATPGAPYTVARVIPQPSSGGSNTLTKMKNKGRL